jgi:hypothetical protein
MSRTIDTFPDPSHGAKLDTGLDESWYRLTGKCVPSDFQLKDLTKFIISEINSGKADVIHGHIRNRTYKNYLPERFYWVCTGWEY